MLKRLANAISLLLVMTVFGGCLYEAKIDEKGGGTMLVKYRLTSAAQFRSAKRRMESPHVKLTEASVDEAKWATFHLQFDDVTKLPTAEFFARSSFSRIDEAEGTTTLTVKFANQDSTKLLDELIEYFGSDVSLSVQVPGEIVKSNAAETAGTTAKWSFPLRDFTEKPEITMQVTYKKAAGAAAVVAATPQSTPPVAAATPPEAAATPVGEAAPKAP